jgi:hypothetical protein
LRLFEIFKIKIEKSSFSAIEIKNTRTQSSWMFIQSLMFFLRDFFKIIKRRRFFKQIVCNNMLDIENVTNFKIEESNSNKSTSNKCIKKIYIKSIQLIDKHSSIWLQSKLHVIKIKTNFFQNFENFVTFFLMTLYFFSHLIRFYFHNALNVSFHCAELSKKNFNLQNSRSSRVWQH